MNKLPMALLGKCLTLAYLSAGVILLITACLVYWLDCPESIVRGIIICVYGVSPFLAGFVYGRVAGSRKFLGGACLGVLFFLGLLLLTVFMKENRTQLLRNAVTAFLMCTAGGTLGGMLG